MKPARLLAPDNTAVTVFFYFACALAFFHIASFAWVADDAYITFRVVDNAVHGFGLRWNIDERVQVYTHPLWMLIHIPFYWAFRNIFLLTIILSAILGAGAVAVMMRSVNTGPLHRAVLVLLPLALCKSFKHHVINGLETPLVLFLLACFWHSLITAPQRIYRLVFFASLALFARLDTAVALLPPALFLLARTRLSGLSLPRLALASSPIWGWLGFSLFYYGFIFPNTKYAKLNTGLSESAYIAQGWHYVENMRIYDRVGWYYMQLSLLAVGALLLWRLYRRIRYRAAMPQNWHIAPLMACSIALHLWYVLRVGGDFMSGRFYATPIFLGVFAAYQSFARVPPLLLAVPLALVINLHGMQRGYDRKHAPSRAWYIFDERGYYAHKQALFKSGGFISNALNGNFVNPANLEKVMRKQPHDTKDVPWEWYIGPNNEIRTVEVLDYLGVWGYTKGPTVVTLDPLGLTEPLLARLPMQGRWHIGHFPRALPPGYEYARETGDTSKMPPGIREYYEHLRMVTSGDLLSPTRLKTIAGFQLGRYDKFLNRYLGRK